MRGAVSTSLIHFGASLITQRVLLSASVYIIRCSRRHRQHTESDDSNSKLCEIYNLQSEDPRFEYRLRNPLV
jgi:uncharacterized protein YcfL